MADPVECLSVDTIIDLHAQALTYGHGGLDGIRSHQQLASAALQPYQAFGGQDLYPSIPEKAAAHAYFLAEGQPFLDGNKRTAALVLTVFLDLHGYTLHEASDTELAEILIDLGRRVITQSEFFGWVCNHAQPADRSKVTEFPKP